MLTYFVSGIMLADYHVIRKAKLKVNDLYNGTSSSIYWFNKGINWRAIVSFLAGVWPLLRKKSHEVVRIRSNISILAGLVGTVNSITDPGFVGWIRLYNLTFIVGLTISFVVFWTLNWCFPPPGLGEEAPFVDGGVLYGVGEETSVESQKELEASADKHAAVTSLSA
jgi:NCS1 family nucleobase:cation symporter-1